MVKIKIISGTYGAVDGNKIATKNRTSEPFEVSEKEAKRLVALNVAEIVVDNVNGDSGSETGVNKVSASKPTISPIEQEKSDSGETENDKPMYDENTSTNEIRTIGKSLGIRFKVGMSKSDMIAALDEYFAENADMPSSDVEGLI